MAFGAPCGIKQPRSYDYVDSLPAPAYRKALKARPSRTLTGKNDMRSDSTIAERITRISTNSENDR